MQRIELSNIRIISNHGCLDEEERIGSNYLVDLVVWADLSKSAHSDNLSDTVDYVHLYNIVKEEMAIRSKLLEHIAQRIKNRISAELTLVQKSELKISKVSPPIGGDVEMVSVVF